jgi:hypothetical protein
MQKTKRITVNGEVRIDTTTSYSEKQIRVDACEWSETEDIAPDGAVSFKGRTIIEPGARIIFKPYRSNTGSRYEQLFETEHCHILRTQGGAIIDKWRFKKSMTNGDILDARKRENARINAFYKAFEA